MSFKKCPNGELVASALTNLLNTLDMYNAGLSEECVPLQGSIRLYLNGSSTSIPNYATLNYECAIALQNQLVMLYDSNKLQEIEMLEKEYANIFETFKAKLESSSCSIENDHCIICV